MEALTEQQERGLRRELFYAEQHRPEDCAAIRARLGEGNAQNRGGGTAADAAKPSPKAKGGK